jgi:hypothetical protein
MPALIYEILNKGWGFLCSIPWFADLKQEVSCDLELQKSAKEANIPLTIGK